MLTANGSFVDILDRIQYKANVTLSWHGDAGVGKRLIVDFAVPNSYSPQTIIHVSHTFPCPWYQEEFMVAQWTEQAKLEWIFDQILKAERHEAREFFKVDGEVFAPPGHGMFEDPYR